MCPKWLGSMEIIKWPEKILQTEAMNVELFDVYLHKLLDMMREAMLDNKGIGIAAPQVNFPLKAAIAGDIELINPIVSHLYGREASVIDDEGCLSLPGVSVPVPRHNSIMVIFQDRNGIWHSTPQYGLMARVIQHEVDHLYGKLIFDRVSSLKREFFKKKLKKLLSVSS